MAIEKDFSEQMKRADIIYFHGGQTIKLLEFLKKQKNLRSSFRGKTIAGKSAGTYALSACFYSKTEGGIFRGLGFVPVKTICANRLRRELKKATCVRCASPFNMNFSE